MTTKTQILFLVLFFSSLSSICLAEEKTKTAEPKKEPFKASTLWGIRRGPNAPKEKAPDKPKIDAEAERMNKYYEEKAKGTYAGSSAGSSSTASNAADCPPTSKP